MGVPLKMITQDATMFYDDVALCSTGGGAVVLDTAIGAAMAEALGDKKALIHQNHGLFTVGETVDEAAFWFISMERNTPGICFAGLWARAEVDGALLESFTILTCPAGTATRDLHPRQPVILAEAAWADWLAEFIETLELAPVHVCGLSFGGGLALELFRRHPQVVRSLILMSAYAGWGGSLPADEVRRRLASTRRNTELPPAKWAPALIDTLLPEGSSPALVSSSRPIRMQIAWAWRWPTLTGE